MHVEHLKHAGNSARLNVHWATGGIPGPCIGVIGVEGVRCEAETYVARVLPTNLAMLNLRVDGPCVDPTYDGERCWAVFGPQTTIREMPVSARGSWLITLFEPAALGAMLNMDVAALTNSYRVLDSSAVEGPALRDLRMISQTICVERAIKDFCEAMPAHFARFTDKKESTVNSYRQKARRHRRQFGVGPREFRKIERLQAALGLISNGTPLSAAAADSGYSDQSHMARSFDKALGSSPGSIRRWISQSPIAQCYAQRNELGRLIAF